MSFVNPSHLKSNPIQSNPLQGGVPCAERCRCVDCKNGPALHRHDMKPRFDFLAAPGTNRKDS